MKKLKYLFLLWVPLAVLLLTGARYYYLVHIWQYQGPPVIFDIRPGEGFSSVNQRLGQNDLISNSKIFYRYCQFQRLMTKFKAGRYQIPTHSRMLDIINLFVSGRSITVSITIPEGKNIYQIADLLEKHSITSKDSFLKLAKDSALAHSLQILGDGVEGHLYPETYHFTPQSDPKTVIKAMVALFRKKTKKLNMANNPLGLNPYQVITLASIVEKETGNWRERSTIAGVFVNRLKRKMRLQSDPTTIYGIFENFDGNLRKKDLLKKTPYNTYKISGLPHGPISNPGLESIQATLSPKVHDYLYFVSQNDGVHVFSRTYKEHLKAVHKYQKSRRMRQGRSWRDLKKKRPPKR